MASVALATCPDSQPNHSWAATLITHSTSLTANSVVPTGADTEGIYCSRTTILFGASAVMRQGCC